MSHIRRLYCLATIPNGQPTRIYATWKNEHFIQYQSMTPEKEKVYLTCNNVNVLIGRGISYHVNICLASLKNKSYLGMISQAIAKTHHFSAQIMIHLIKVLLEKIKMQKMLQQIQRFKTMALEEGQMKKTSLKDLLKKCFPIKPCLCHANT